MNALMSIRPYLHNGLWCFDDSKVALHAEPFVCGIGEIIDVMVADIPRAARGFNMIFSAGEFPGFQVHLVFLRGDQTGTWYRWAEREMDGWLCPALFKYFPQAPKHIYARALEIRPVQVSITQPRTGRRLVPA